MDDTFSARACILPAYFSRHSRNFSRHSRIFLLLFLRFFVFILLLSAPAIRHDQ
jgi:hypothetical protein